MRTLKKRLALLLSALLLVSALPTAAWAGDVQASEGTLPTYTSLLPLDEEHLYLDLSGRLPLELESVPVQDIISSTTNYSGSSMPISVAPGDTIVWARDGDDDFQFVSLDGTIDLSTESQYSTTTYLTLIVGDGDQLNPNNKRYEVNVTVSPAKDIFDAQATSEEGADIPVYNTYLQTRSGGDVFQLGVDPQAWQRGEQAYLTLDLTPEFTSGLTAKVYAGLYNSEAAALAAGAEDITAQIWGAGAEGYLADYSYQSGYKDMPEVTVILERNGQVAYIGAFILYMYEAGLSLSYSSSLYADVEGQSWRQYVSGNSTYNYDKYQRITIEVDREYPADGEYYFGLWMNNPAAPDNAGRGVEYVESAAVGYYEDLAEMPGEGDPKNIKDQLFSDPYNAGFKADFSNGVTFSVLDINGAMDYVEVTTVAEPDTLPDAPEPDSIDTYFRVEGAQDGPGESGGTYYEYVMPYQDDSYYYNGYQTVFLLERNDGSDQENYPTDVYSFMPVADEEIVPLFYTGNKVTMYAGEGTTSGTKQESGETALPFESGQAIQYSAAAESGSHLKNYWVTYLTLQPGSKLFVNATNFEGHYDHEGYPVREVFLDDAHNYRHDIFIANIGTQELTGLTVTLSDAENIQLDEYWKVREDSTQTLGAFDDYYNMDNIAKIRLVALEGAQGVISGTLTISADDQEDVVIKLTGVAGVPKITTTDILDGVKYVPYSSVIQTNSMNASDAIEFDVVDGKLPQGVELKPNGELYGVPTEYGEFTFTVKASYNGDDALSDTAEFTMTVLNNTNDNVEGSTDPGYELDTRVPDRLTEFTDQVFESRGKLGEFQDFWLDGKKLEEGVDYIAKDGSTRITIKAQTFQAAGNGTHTIAAEFRVDGNVNNELKKAAQNYTAGSEGSGGGGGGGGSSSSSSTYYTPSAQASENGSLSLSSNRAKKGDVVTITVKPDAGYELDKLTVTDNQGNAVETQQKSENTYSFTMPAGNVQVKATFKEIPPEITPADDQPFLDVAEGAWYVDAVKYAYENGLMAGVSATEFAPQMTTSRGMVVTILYSLEGKPAVSGCAFQDVAADAYYANATCWAAQNGIVSGYGGGVYGPNDPVTREQMAIIMMNYAKFKGYDVSKQADLSSFTDISISSVGAREALAWANAEGLLTGKGNGILDPVGQATRAEAAAILGQFHRLMAEPEQDMPQDARA